VENAAKPNFSTKLWFELANSGLEFPLMKRIRRDDKVRRTRRIAHKSTGENDCRNFPTRPECTDDVVELHGRGLMDE